ncbi:hypothetical protein GCM10010349_16640 [Streptomyces flavofungini]|nr:hypothetical protein GCM10010349_16640 [Streptomyces flavofungini]
MESRDAPGGIGVMMTSAGACRSDEFRVRCGTPREFAENPSNRLCPTLGPREEQSRGVVSHEHHSFPVAPPDTASS